MNILSDVNLDEISFSKDGKSIELYFIDMNEGEGIGTLKCIGVLSFKYQNYFEDDDSLAAYIGEVNYEKIKSTKRLKSLNYNYHDGELQMEGGLTLINIEGGELVLEVICREAEFKKKGLLILWRHLQGAAHHHSTTQTIENRKVIPTPPKYNQVREREYILTVVVN